MNLAEHFHEVSIDSMLDKLSSRDLTYWRAYFKVKEVLRKQETEPQKMLNDMKGSR